MTTRTITCDNCCSANNPANLVGSILQHNSEGEHDGTTISISDTLSSLFSYWVGVPEAKDVARQLQFCPGCAHIFRKLHKISIQFQKLCRKESQVAKRLTELRKKAHGIIAPPLPPSPPLPTIKVGQQPQQQVRRSLRNHKVVDPVVVPEKKKKTTQKMVTGDVPDRVEEDQISFHIKDEDDDYDDVCFDQQGDDGMSDIQFFDAIVEDHDMGEADDFAVEKDAQETTSNLTGQSKDDDEGAPDDEANVSDDDESSNYSPSEDSDSEPTSPSKNPLKCSICFQKFATLETKNRHFRLQHDHTFTLKPCPAEDCDLSFKRFDHLRNHLKRKHPEVTLPGVRKRFTSGDNDPSFTLNRLPCPVDTCEKTYSRTDHLNIHIKAAHPGVPVVKRKKSAKTLKKKKNDEEKDKSSNHSSPAPGDDGDETFNPLRCSVCFKKFSSVETTDRHFRHQHDETFIPLLCPCDNCDLTFKRRDHLKRHLDNKHPDFVETKDESSLPAEADSDSDSIPNPLKCSICFKKFSTVDSKERHFRHQHDESFTPLPCPADNCDLTFKRRDHLQRHLARRHPTIPIISMRSQRKEDNFDALIPCPVDTCEKTYSRTDHLNVHIKAAHPGVPVQKRSKKGMKYKTKGSQMKLCPDCGKGIKSSRMNEHMETHASEKTHLCNTCGKLFRTRKGLSHHLKTCTK